MKSLGLKGPGLKLGVEKSGVEMSVVEKSGVEMSFNLFIVFVDSQSQLPGHLSFHKIRIGSII